MLNFPSNQAFLFPMLSQLFQQQSSKKYFYEQNGEFGAIKDWFKVFSPATQFYRLTSIER